MAPYDGEGDATNERAELVDGVALQAELTRLRRKVNTSTLDNQEASLLSYLEAFDKEAEPADNHVIRRLRVVYGKNAEVGRRTASYPSAQHCPSTLRKRLFKLWYHDVDIVNCHPTLMVQLVTKMGKAEQIPKLCEYMLHRGPMLERIAEHFGCDAKLAKDLVLRVLNGGSMTQWLEDNHLTNPLGEQTTFAT